MSRGSNNSESESIGEEIREGISRLYQSDDHEFAGLDVSQVQVDLVDKVQEAMQGIGARVSTDPQDPSTAQLPPDSPSQEASQLQRDQASTINLLERVIEEVPLTRMEAADGLPTTVTMAAARLTPAEKCAGMFKKSDPINKETLAQGACELPHEMRGDAPREIKKNKEIHAKGIACKFCLHEFQQITGYVNDDDDAKTSLHTTSAKDALLSNSYLCKLFLQELKAMDCQKAINVPKLVDQNGLTPANHLDFNERLNAVDDHAMTPWETVLLHAEACMLWGANFIECLKDVAIEQQDQEWTLTTIKNLCTNGHKVNIASIFNKLPGHQHTGVVYIWIMLDIIANVTPDAAKGLKEQLKQLGQK